MSNVYEAFQPGALNNGDLIAPNAPLFVGLECEIESILQTNEHMHSFSPVNDHSLRNHGMEFVSKPTPIMNIVPEFTKLHSSIKFRDLSQRFSERTSIHVHVNCCNIEIKEVKNIILMYALFEEFFFMLVHPKRRHNIHCVALTETYLPSMYKHDLGTLVNKWHKYTALNIKPLTSFGTIEFRHMEGHADDALLGSWLKTINNVMEVGKNNPIDAKTLTSNNIKVWFRSIFGHTNLAPLEASVDSIAFNQILDLKMAVM